MNRGTGVPPVRTAARAVPRSGAQSRQSLRIGGIDLRLRNRVRAIEEESHDLLKYFFPNVHRAVDALARLAPIYFAGSDFARLSLSAVAELDGEEISTQDHSYPVKGITMPRRRLPRRQPLSPDQVIPPMMQNLLLPQRAHYSLSALICVNLRLKDWLLGQDSNLEPFG